jgi:hypothetical protein
VELKAILAVDGEVHVHLKNVIEREGLIKESYEYTTQLALLSFALASPSGSGLFQDEVRSNPALWPC